MKYCPHTQEETNEMLETIGVNQVEDLFKNIKPELRAKSFNLPEGKSEFEVFDHLKTLSLKNNSDLKLFLGGGYYDHYIPSVVDALTSRTEFYTPYTPYQPEASQGTLQALYEYQTAICNLTDLDVSNASMYDGGTALAEAVLMGFRINKKRNKVLIDGAINPLYKDIVRTYLSFFDYEIVEIPFQNFNLNKDVLTHELNEDVASVILANPNFFGYINDYTSIIDKIHEVGALAILSVYPISLGLIKSPGEMGADIVTGEGQSLGNPLNFGGPYFGFMATTTKNMRNLPGRIAGKTTDKNDNDCYVLTLQAREQHIRRQKATSNICSNQNLCALRALVYLSSLGKKGFKELALQIYHKTSYAINVLSKLKDVKVIKQFSSFNEFLIELPKEANNIVADLQKKNIIAGLPLSVYYPDLKKHLLVSITEKIKKQDIDDYAHKLGGIL